MTKEQAQAFVDSVVSIRTDASDKEASEAVGIYPMLHNDGRLIEAGTRINWNGKLMRAAVDLYDNAQSTPKATPTLWEEIEYRNGIRIIPEVITTGKAFSDGEKGWWKDAIWVSQRDANVWTPDALPSGWIKE